MVHFAQSNSPGFRTLSSAKESPSGVDLVRLGKWLLSLSGQDQGLLRHTREFRDFIDATRRLEKAQRNLEVWNAMNDTSTTKDGSVNSKCSFLQYVVSDESVLCVLDYLESYSLVQIATTCTRLRNLAYQNARIRCKGIESERQLTDVMHLLRAKEQIEGLDWESDFLLNSIVRSKPATFPSVRIPALLPGRRVLVTGAGDLEFNGVYFCTGCNGNGFVFTKPRYPFQRIPERERNSIQDGEMSREPPNLNCIFARRFSGQDLLWYLSKEICQAVEGDEPILGKSIVEIFSFWAPLPTTGSTTPHLNSYPNQSSVLGQRDQQTWQCLETTSHFEPPTVEIVD